MRLHDYLEFYADTQPNHVFAQYNLPEGKQTITYAEANAQANQMARALLASGFTKGDRFAYLSRNSTHYVLMYLAAAKAGVVPVLLNYRLAPREWLYIIGDSQATMVMADAEYAAGIETIREELSTVSRFVTVGGSADKKVPGWEDYDTWVAGQESANLNQPVEATDQLYQMYTSGTTGLPKGVMISHQAIDANCTMLARLINIEQSRERAIIAAPLYHAGAGVVSMAHITMGSTLVIHKDFVPGEFVDSLIDDKITMGGLVPAMLQACLVAVPDIANRQFPDLKSMFYGASPIAEETLRTAMQVFECDFVQGFGMTETSAAATGLTAEHHQRAVNGEPHLLLSAGKAVLGTEVRIVDEQDNEVPTGTIGEIAVRGPQLMTGYWNLEEASAKALKDGWMHTGDAATMDSEGFIYIQDRIKDMIVSGGENIYPREIENALFEHPNVADAAVIGVPSEQWGESILAFVVPKPDTTIEETDLMMFCRDRLAGYKVPRAFEFIADLPRNASGKVLKKDLREPYWEGVDRRVS